MWYKGEHCKPEHKLANTNFELGQIKGELSTEKAQTAFARFCYANPHFASRLLIGIDIYPFQDIMIRTMFSKDFFLGICGRGLGKSTLAGVFIPLYAIMHPGVQIGITSAGFRQARNIFEKIEEFIKSEEGSFLRNCVDMNSIKHNSDAWTMKIGKSSITALPLGCVGYNESILTKEGWVKASTLAKGVKGEWSSSSATVMTDEGYSRCSHMKKTPEQKVIHFRTLSGFEFKVTPDTPVKVQAANDAGYEWVNAASLGGRAVIIDRSPKRIEQPKYSGTFLSGHNAGSSQRFKTSLDKSFYSCSLTYGRGFISGVVESSAVEVYSKSGALSGLEVKFENTECARDFQMIASQVGFIFLREKSVVFLEGVELSLFLDELRLKNDHWNKRKGKPPIKTNEFVDRVFVVSKKKKAKCLDLRVPAINNYIVNGVCCHNSGDKIRGYRFNLLVIDELLLLSERIISEVLLPFMAIQQNQRERQKVRVAEQELIDLGELDEDDRTIFENNKLIGLTSASYEFENLYKMYVNYKDMIFDKEAKNVSHAIMRLSAEMAPEGMYDKGNLETSRKTLSSQQFEREYMANFTGDSGGFFSAKLLHNVSLIEGESPSIKVKGDPEKKYLLALDPNYDAAETSDHFAMCVMELNEAEETMCMVHGYAVASCSLQERMSYVRYLFDNFNIEYFIVDKAGGEKFIKDINDLNILDFSLGFFENNIASFSPEELFEAKVDYNPNGGKIKKIVHSQYFSSQWIRISNETLQTNIEGRKIWFGAPIEAENLNKDGINMKNIFFTEKVKYKNSPSELKMKFADFVDHQSEIVALTKQECSLIEITSSVTGVQKFDLPPSLRNQTGPDKARRDSYSVLLLANWGAECLFAMNKTQEVKRKSFIPRFLRG